MLAVAIVGGGAVTAIYMAKRGDSVPEVTETDAYTDVPASTDEATDTTPESGPDIEVVNPVPEDESLLKTYLEETLIPEHGVYDVSQPAYFVDIYGVIDKASFTFDPETNTFSSEHILLTAQGNEDYPPMQNEFNTVINNMDKNGISGANIADYDGDGEAELLAIYGEDSGLYLEMFDIRDGKAASAGKLSFDELLTDELKQAIEEYGSVDGYGPFMQFVHEYITRSIGRYVTADGTAYIVMADETNQGYTRTTRYLRISGILEPVSCMLTNVGTILSDVAIDFYYD